MGRREGWTDKERKKWCKQTGEPNGNQNELQGGRVDLHELLLSEDARSDEARHERVESLGQQDPLSRTATLTTSHLFYNPMTRHPLQDILYKTSATRHPLLNILYKTSHLFGNSYIQLTFSKRDA